MKKAIPLLLTVIFTLAFAGNECASASSRVETEPIKLYYETFGSNDYIFSGTTTVSNPTDANSLDDTVWTAIASPSNTPDRLTHATVYDPVEDKIYMIGGTPNGTAGSNVNLCQQYDPETNTWTDKATMPTPKGWINGVYVRGKIYCIGGLNNSNAAINENAEYTIATNTWTTKAPRPRVSLASLDVVWRDSLIYVMGGWNNVSGSSGYTEVDIYDPFTNNWSVGTPLPLNGDMGDAVIIDDTIYIPEAVNRIGTTATCWPNLYKGAINPANPTQITWIQGPAHSSPTSICGVAALNGNVYWLGGFLNLSSVTNRSWVYDRTTGTINNFINYSVTLARCCFMTARSTESASELYVMAGDSGGNWNPPNRVYMKSVFEAPRDHDVGVYQILAPAALIPSAPLAPRAEIKNFGTNPESDIPVYCWIDSSGTRVYEESYTYAGPLAPNATAQVTFSSNWTPGGDGATYQVTMFTDLSGDENEANDTMRRTTTVQSAPAFGTQLQTWTMPIGRTYAMVGITYRPDSNRYYIACMQPNQVWSFSPSNPTATLRNENWTIRQFYGNDVAWGIAWDPVTEGFWLTQVENYQTACKAARYVNGQWAGTPADSWELWSVEPSTWYGGLDYNYDAGYFWNTKVGGTNRFYKLDLHNKTSLGYAPGPTSSYRANSYFGHGHNFLVSGGWNQDQIIKFDTLGAIITQAPLSQLADCDIYEPTNPVPESVIVAYCTVQDANNTLVKVSMGLTWGSVGVESEPNKPTTISNVTINSIPNPVIDHAIIAFSLPVRSSVKINVFDATGRAIRNLTNSTYESGNHTISWDGKDENAHRVANGIYFYTLETTESSITRKLILMK